MKKFVNTKMKNNLCKLHKLFFCAFCLLTTTRQCGIIVGPPATGKARIAHQDTICEIFIVVWSRPLQKYFSRNDGRLPAAHPIWTRALVVLICNSLCAARVFISHLTIIKKYDTIVKKAFFISAR